MEENSLELKDILAILKHRKWDFIITAVCVFIVVAIIALVWPPTYRSTATMLIESQGIPTEYVRSTVTAFAEQRLQAINQRITSSSTLMEIIKRFNLYADKRKNTGMEQIVDDMRKKHIKLETINASVIDPQTRRPGSATIAFTVSFEGERPDVVLQVTNMLSSLYLEENLKIGKRQTENASRFIEDESRTIKENLAELDGKIAAFKGRNLNSLPELSQFNIQSVDRLDGDIDRLRDQLRTLKEKEISLQTQMVSIPKDTSNPDRERLKQLRAMIINLRTRYSESYPDVIKTKQEIAELERRLGSSAKDNSMAGAPDNPAYIALSSQLAGTQSDIESIKRQINDFQSKKDGYRRRIESGPKVEEEYKALLLERNHLQLKYDDLMKKLMEAKVAQGLEEGQMGERFTLIDPARLPEKPVSPNRPVILVFGLMLGIGAGIGVVGLRHLIDQSAHTVRDLARATKMQVFTGITKIVTRDDIENQKLQRKRLMITTGIVLLFVLVIFHLFVMNLDVLSAKIGRRLL